MDLIIIPFCCRNHIASLKLIGSLKNNNYQLELRMYLRIDQNY